MARQQPQFTRFSVSNKKYEREDGDVFDYQLFRQFDLNIRGPEWTVDSKSDLNIVGSSRVFGRLVHDPFAKILSDNSIIARNIGYSGCTPTSTFNNKSLMEYLKSNCGIPVLQLCALDGGKSDWYTPARNRRVTLDLEGVRVNNKRQLRGILRRSESNVRLFSKLHNVSVSNVKRLMRNDIESLPAVLPPGILDRAGRLLLIIAETYGPAAAVEQIKKTQDWAFREYERLVNELRRPVILLSFYAEKRPMLDETNFVNIVSTFPQFVDRSFSDQVAGLFADHIQVIGNDGVGYIKPGETEVFRDQYPTQEMHTRCAEEIQKWYRRQQELNSPLLQSRSHARSDAEVMKVKITPDGPSTFRFNVTVRHPDTGWDDFADRWEILTPDGRSLGVRVMKHPHVHKQPFTRSLDGVAVPEDVNEVTVRAHDSVDGWGDATLTVKVPR